MPDIIKEYVDTGKVRIVFKDFAFLGDDSRIAAMYEHAIWKLYPNRFYDWRMEMFKAQDEEGDAGFGDEASILALIKKMGGMDANKLKADVTANVTEYAKLADDDKAEAAAIGIGGTPGFVTGKTLIPGAVGIEEFRKAFDEQL
jgi:protein-disulfide isomerase